MMGLHKVRTLWRLAQRKTKDQELRQDIEIFSQTFTRVMDCKDSAIEVAAGLAGQGGCQETHMTPPQNSTGAGQGAGRSGGAAEPSPAQPPAPHGPTAAAPALPPGLPGGGV